MGGAYIQLFLQFCTSIIQCQSVNMQTQKCEFSSAKLCSLFRAGYSNKDKMREWPHPTTKMIYENSDLSSFERKGVLNKVQGDKNCVLNVFIACDFN